MDRLHEKLKDSFGGIDDGYGSLPPLMRLREAMDTAFRFVNPTFQNKAAVAVSLRFLHRARPPFGTLTDIPVFRP
jgi:hypothetical protein